MMMLRKLLYLKLFKLSCLLKIAFVSLSEDKELAEIKFSLGKLYLELP